MARRAKDQGRRKSRVGMDTGQEKKLRKLELENERLKRLVENLRLDNAILKAALLGY